jgi:hypothetical protein
MLNRLTFEFAIKARKLSTREFQASRRDLLVHFADKTYEAACAAKWKSSLIRNDANSGTSEKCCSNGVGTATSSRQHGPPSEIQNQVEKSHIAVSDCGLD